MSPEKKKRRPPTGRAELDQVVVTAIEEMAGVIHKTIRAGRKPVLAFPVRNLGNVSYDHEKGYLEIGDAKSERTLTLTTAKSFAQTLLMMELSRKHVREDEHSTKREAYYISKNWADARFDAQEESDTVLDDVEAMFAERGITREQLRFTPEEHGGKIAGELIVVDRDEETQADVFVDCTAFGTASYAIPSDVEHLRFETKAKFVLCIETGGVFDRLNRKKFWRDHNCILVEMGGVPSRACRRFVRRLADDKRIPVYAFTDCDPYGFANIYRTLKAGSGNAAHINQFYCVPQASFLGVTPDDIEKYGLETHPLKPVDVKRAQDALKNDPFFSSHKPWVKAIEKQIRMGQRAEQQAFAKDGLDFVYKNYLPEKLANVKAFLP